ncbi:transcription factor S [Candidatus Woesearchaeota archaeon]|nr:transcription factor S [Candidatus Woesearchaeota archaeon]
MPKKNGSKKVIECSCGYKPKEEQNLNLKETVDDHEEVAVVDQEVDPLPTTAEECPKCAHPEAYYWLVQTRAGDEPETKFLKCIKCKHTWRNND